MDLFIVLFQMKYRDYIYFQSWGGYVDLWNM